VLVIDGKGDQSSALMGTIMMTACQKLGIAGVVMDGAARDSIEIEEMGYPVFSVGTNPNGPTKNIGGRIGHPVAVGDVTVYPGDFVIADADGVVVVEREKIEALLPLAAKKVKDEAARIEAIKGGDTAAKWLTQALRTAGVLKEGETL
jgi:regulator of RNase E activity RraA